MAEPVLSSQIKPVSRTVPGDWWWAEGIVMVLLSVKSPPQHQGGYRTGDPHHPANAPKIGPDDRAILKMH